MLPAFHAGVWVVDVNDAFDEYFIPRPVHSRISTGSVHMREWPGAKGSSSQSIASDTPTSS